MAKNKSGQTAFGAAIARLIEQYEPDKLRLFDDKLIRHVLPNIIARLMKIKFFRNRMLKMFDKQTKGIYGAQICRTKYIDEKIKESLANVQQILILGSGLDTRPYRIQALKNIPVFEVDLASVQEFKKKKIKKYFGSLPSNISYVAIDFNSQTPAEVLNKNHFNFKKPTFIIWEGVTQYITKEAVEKMFDFIATIASGSSLVFTYIIESVIKKQSDIPGTNELMKYFEKRKSAWLFGIEPAFLQTFLEKYNLKIIEDVDTNYFQKNFLQPIGRQLAVTKIERTAFATIIPTTFQPHVNN
jgi:methyltransferase (TIGR00027 family)